VTRANLTKYERQDLKVYVRDCVISKFSRQESLAYVRAQLHRNDITIYDIDRIKSASKKDDEKWMQSLMKDRYAYVSHYRERIDECYKHEKELWRIFYSNMDNPHIQTKCIALLQNSNAALTSLYDILPEIAGGQFTDVKEHISKTTEETPPTVAATKSTAWTA